MQDRSTALRAKAERMAGLVRRRERHGAALGLGLPIIEMVTKRSERNFPSNPGIRILSGYRYFRIVSG
eukprot:3473594-Prymnesium_polylepis.1